MPADPSLAVVDMGSNSFRLLIARVESSLTGRRIVPVGSDKQTVRLARGLRADGTLDEDSRQRALAAMTAFERRLRFFPANRVRAVATSTLRVASGTERFLAQAEKALGAPIEIISGRTEARLIYLGVAHELPTDGRKRLVIDIGGGSTESVVGKDHQAIVAASSPVGCVTLSSRHFPGGFVSRDSFEAARHEARAAFALLARRVSAHHPEYAIGTSGTARSLIRIAQQHWGREALDRHALAYTRDALTRAGHPQALELRGLDDDRKPVLAGGLAIMMAAFDAFDIAAMHYCDSALCHGLVHSLVAEGHRQLLRPAITQQA